LEYKEVKMNANELYLSGAIGINLIVLVYLAYNIIKIKRMIKREIQNESNY